jgi:hypothetical protein
MSNLTSSVPGAFNAFYNLLVTAGQTQSPQVPVFHTELVGDIPLSYVVLTGVENHEFEFAALGSYAQYETYEIVGEAVVFQGGTDTVGVLTATWSLYQNVVMSTVVANRGQPGGNQILGSTAPTSLEILVPSYARYSGQPGNLAGGLAGVLGTVQFSYYVKARITVP